MKKLSRDEMKAVAGGARPPINQCGCYSNSEPRPVAYCLGSISGEPEPTCPENFAYFCPCPN